MKPRRIRSIRGPLILFVCGMALVVALLVLWNVVLAVDYRALRELATRAEQAGAAFHWTFIALGSVFFVAIIVLFSVLGAQLFAEIRFAERLSSFVAAFTHELNSPLASIKLFAQTLRRPELPARDRERFLDLLLADVERLHKQLANVLRAGQVDDPLGVALAPEPVELRAYLQAYLSERRAAAERLEAPVTLELLPGPEAWARIDPQVFRQVLDNLIDNSIKYARRGGVRIQIALEPAGEWLALEVRDDGRGILAADLPRIFDRFGRGTPVEGQDSRPGAGLGLWIVHALVAAHGGQVEARSPGLERGATLVVRLPRLGHEATHGPDAAGAAPGPDPSAGSDDASGTPTEGGPAAVAT